MDRKLTPNEALLSEAPNQQLAGRLKIVAWVLTAVILVVVSGMRQVKIDLPAEVDLSFLPAVHAVINSIVAVLLGTALAMIKRGNITAHKRATSAAMLCSIAFLVGYVAYHTTSEHTKYGGEGPTRYVYYTLLARTSSWPRSAYRSSSTTWIYGFTGQFSAHRRIAKLVFPVWLYVAITAPFAT